MYKVRNGYVFTTGDKRSIPIGAGDTVMDSDPNIKGQEHKLERITGTEAEENATAKLADSINIDKDLIKRMSTVCILGASGVSTARAALAEVSDMIKGQTGKSLYVTATKPGEESKPVEVAVANADTITELIVLAEAGDKSANAEMVKVLESVLQATGKRLYMASDVVEDKKDAPAKPGSAKKKVAPNGDVQS